MADQNLVPKLGLGAVLAFIAYGAVVAPNGTEGGPVEVLGGVGAGLMCFAIMMTIATTFLAARRAFRSGSWAWFVAVIFVWPLTYLYALVVKRSG